MYGLANRRSFLGQMQPFLTPTLAPFTPNEAAVTAPPASVAQSGDGAGKVALVGVSLLYAALGATSALFSYGVARESQSKMVRTTGYILAGVAGLGALATLIGGPLMAAMAGEKR